MPEARDYTNRKPFRLGRWTVDPSTGELANGAIRRRVEPKVIEVLLHLIDCAPGVLRRSDLADTVWGDVVVCDATITQAVVKLRRALDDDANQPLFVETIPKVGYRLVAEVEQGPFVRSKINRVRPRLAVPAVAVAAASAALLMAASLTVLEVPEVAHSESYPEVSPDGTHLAYSVKADGWDVFVRNLESGTSRRITDGRGDEWSPRWSPRGWELAYLRVDSDGCEIVRASLLTGERNAVARCDGQIPWKVFDWSPDGRWMVVPERSRTSIGGQGLSLLNVETLERRSVSEPVSESSIDHSVSFSPDSRQLVFARETESDSELYRFDLESGTVCSMVPNVGRVEGTTWTAGGESVVFAADRGRGRKLWRTEVESGSLEEIPTTGAEPKSPSIRGHHLVYAADEPIPERFHRGGGGDIAWHVQHDMRIITSFY